MYSIMILDNSEVELIMMQKAFEKDFNVTAMNNSKQALARLNKATIMPDIVIMDVVLTGISGFEVLTRLMTGEKTKDCRVIMISGEFTAMNNIQQYLESNGYEIMSAKFDRFPNTDLKQLSAEDQASVEKLLEKIEEDEDVQNVYHNMQQ